MSLEEDKCNKELKWQKEKKNVLITLRSQS